MCRTSYLYPRETVMLKVIKGNSYWGQMKESLPRITIKIFFRGVVHVYLIENTPIKKKKNIFKKYIFIL